MRQGQGQHQPAAFAARQHLDGRAGLLRLKQEILHVADDVTFFSVDDHRVAASTGQGRGDASLGVEVFALLIEGGHFEIGAELHAARVRLQRTGEYIDERRLARSVGPNETDAAVATRDLDIEVAHQIPVAIAFADAPRFDDFPPGLLGLVGWRIFTPPCTRFFLARLRAPHNDNRLSRRR